MSSDKVTNGESGSGTFPLISIEFIANDDGLAIHWQVAEKDMKLPLPLNIKKQLVMDWEVGVMVTAMRSDRLHINK